MNKRGFWTYCRGYTYFSSIADDFDTWSNHARAACTDVRRMHHYPKHHEKIVVVSSFYAVVLSAFSVGAVSGLQKNKSLKSLCLAACRLGNQGIALLCIHRASWKFLEGFRLRDSLHNYRIVEHCWTFTYFNQFRRKCCWHTSKHWALGWWDGCVSFSHLVAENWRRSKELDSFALVHWQTIFRSLAVKVQLETGGSCKEATARHSQCHWLSDLSLPEFAPLG